MAVSGTWGAVGYLARGGARQVYILLHVKCFGIAIGPRDRGAPADRPRIMHAARLQCKFLRSASRHRHRRVAAAAAVVSSTPSAWAAEAVRSHRMSETSIYISLPRHGHRTSAAATLTGVLPYHGPSRQNT